jgi:hypothetical protein
MKLVFSKEEIAELIGQAAQKKGFWDLEKQHGFVKWEFTGNSWDWSTLQATFSTTPKEIPAPSKEPYEAGDWKDTELEEFFTDENVDN